MKLNVLIRLTACMLAVIILGVSCVKNDAKCTYPIVSRTPSASEVQALQDSLTKYGITATQSPYGFYYTIISQGSGNSVANLCTTITSSYKGSFFNGHIFDSTAAGQSATFQLGQTIVGWQEALPLLNKNGEMNLYVPPTLGYGSTAQTDAQGNTVIPANSYLVFNIKVTDIQ